MPSLTTLQTYFLHFTWLWVFPVLALAWFAPRIGDPLLRRMEALGKRFARNKPRTVLLVAAAAILGRLALLPVFHVPVPVVNDEFSYLLAGDTFAHGRLTNPTPAMTVFFGTFDELQQPTYQSMYPPAQGAVLALGELLGSPWIGVLLSVAAMCAALTWMLQAWFPPHWALIGGILAIVRLDMSSYWSQSYWGGAVALMAAALVMGALPRIKRYRRVRDAVILSAGVAILANSRPAEGFIFCLPVAAVLILWLFSKNESSRRNERQAGRSLPSDLIRIVVPITGVLAVTLLFTGYYNWRVTGSALVFPHSLEMLQVGGVQVFIWQPPLPISHSINPQIYNFSVWDLEAHLQPFSLANLRHRINYDGFVWWDFFMGFALTIPFLTIPSLLKDRRMRLPLVQILISGVALLCVNWFSPHYAAPMAAAYFLLLLQAMRHLRCWKFKRRPVGIFLTRLVVLLAVIRVPVAARSWPPVLQYGLDRARIEAQLNAMPGNHLVIVHYTEDGGPQDHGPGQHEWVHNAADLDRTHIVWAREIPGVDLKPLLDYYRDRKIWLVNADAPSPSLEAYSPR
jgi:hypothetical protein